MKSISLETGKVPPIAVLSDSRVEASRLAESVGTCVIFSVPASRVWDGLVFYEQIRERPPLLLRLLLPTPLGTEGGKFQLGEQVRCFYSRGHLVKALTHIDPGHKLAFRVIEQKIVFGGGIKLVGGHYTLQELPNGSTQVILTTEYYGVRQPRCFWKRVEASVCHVFHRFILRQMRNHLGA